MLVLTAMLVFVSSCGNKETENLIEEKTEAGTEDPSVSEKRRMNQLISKKKYQRRHQKLVPAKQLSSAVEKSF